MVINNNTSQGFGSDLPAESKSKLDTPAAQDSGSKQGSNKAKIEARPGAIMFQTTKINSLSGALQNNTHYNAQFKYNIPAQSFNLLEHEFSRLKYESDGKADFNGFPDDLDVEYTEDELDYKQVRVNLALEGDPFPTKDRFNPKESLKLLEISALQKMHEESTMNIDGLEIVERPEITMHNLNRVPAYSDWSKVIFNEKNHQNNDQSPRSCQNRVMSSLQGQQSLQNSLQNQITSHSQPNSIQTQAVQVLATAQDTKIQIKTQFITTQGAENQVSKGCQVKDDIIRGEAELTPIGQKRGFKQMMFMASDEEEKMAKIYLQNADIDDEEQAIQHLDLQTIDGDGTSKRLKQNDSMNKELFKTNQKEFEEAKSSKQSFFFKEGQQIDQDMIAVNTQQQLVKIENYQPLNRVIIKDKNEYQISNGQIQQISQQAVVGQAINQGDEYQTQNKIIGQDNLIASRLSKHELLQIDDGQNLITSHQQQQMIHDHQYNTHDDLSEAQFTQIPQNKVLKGENQIQIIQGDYGRANYNNMSSQPQQIIYYNQTPCLVLQRGNNNQGGTQIISASGGQSGVIQQQIIPTATIINANGQSIQTHQQVASQNHNNQIVIASVAPSDMQNQTQSTQLIALQNPQNNQIQVIQSQPQGILAQTQPGQNLIPVQSSSQHQQVQIVQTNQGPVLIQQPQTSQATIITTANGQQTLHINQPNQVQQAQPQYQLATTSSGQQVLIQIQSQNQQIQQINQNLSVGEPLTYIQTPQGIVLTQSNQHHNQKPPSIGKQTTQYINEYGQLVQVIQQPAHQIQQIYEIDPIQTSTYKHDIINTTQGPLQILSQQSDLMQQQQQEPIQLMYDSVTGQYIQVQTIPPDIDSPQNQYMYQQHQHHNQQYLQQISGQNIQIRQQQQQQQLGQTYDHGIQYQTILNDPPSYVPYTHVEQNQRNNYQNNQGAYHYHQQSGVCNHCHRSKSQSQGRSNSQNQRGNFNGYKKTEHQCPGHQPQIVYQPFQVIKSNIYQTQYNTTNQVQIPENMAATSAGTLIQEILPQQVSEYQQTNQYQGNYGEMQDQNQYNMSSRANEYQQTRNNTYQIDNIQSNQFNEQVYHTNNNLINQTAKTLNISPPRDIYQPPDPFKYSSKHAKDTIGHLSHTQPFRQSLKSVSKKSSSPFLLNSHFGLQKQQKEKDHSSYYKSQMPFEDNPLNFPSSTTTKPAIHHNHNQSSFKYPLTKDIFSVTTHPHHHNNSKNLNPLGINFQNQNKKPSNNSNNNGGNNSINSMSNQQRFKQNFTNSEQKSQAKLPRPNISSQDMLMPMEYLSRHGLNPQQNELQQLSSPDLIANEDQIQLHLQRNNNLNQSNFNQTSQFQAPQQNAYQNEQYQQIPQALNQQYQAVEQQIQQVTNDISQQQKGPNELFFIEQQEFQQPQYDQQLQKQQLQQFQPQNEYDQQTNFQNVQENMQIIQNTNNNYQQLVNSDQNQQINSQMQSIQQQIYNSYDEQNIFQQQQQVQPIVQNNEAYGDFTQAAENQMLQIQQQQQKQQQNNLVNPQEILMIQNSQNVQMQQQECINPRYDIHDQQMNAQTSMATLLSQSANQLSISAINLMEHNANQVISSQAMNQEQLQIQQQAQNLEYQFQQQQNQVLESQALEQQQQQLLQIQQLQQQQDQSQIVQNLQNFSSTGNNQSGNQTHAFSLINSQIQLHQQQSNESQIDNDLKILRGNFNQSLLNNLKPKNSSTQVNSSVKSHYKNNAVPALESHMSTEHFSPPRPQPSSNRLNLSRASQNNFQNINAIPSLSHQQTSELNQSPQINQGMIMVNQQQPNESIYQIDNQQNQGVLNAIQNNLNQNNQIILQDQQLYLQNLNSNSYQTAQMTQQIEQIQQPQQLQISQQEYQQPENYTLTQQQQQNNMNYYGQSQNSQQQLINSQMEQNHYEINQINQNYQQTESQKQQSLIQSEFIQPIQTQMIMNGTQVIQNEMPQQLKNNFDNFNQNGLQNNKNNFANYLPQLQYDQVNEQQIVNSQLQAQGGIYGYENPQQLQQQILQSQQQSINNHQTVFQQIGGVPTAEQVSNATFLPYS